MKSKITMKKLFFFVFIFSKIFLLNSLHTSPLSEEEYLLKELNILKLQSSKLEVQVKSTNIFLMI